MAMLDLRRTDRRTNTLYNPYWTTSAEITPACDDTEAVLFSFPTISPIHFRGLLILQEICCEVITAFAGGTITLDIGMGTIPLESTTTGGVVTETDVDEYIDNTEITHGTPAVYFPATGDWITAKLLMTNLASTIITPADSTVPVIYAKLASDAVITAGVARVHAMLNVVPLMG